MSCPRCGGSSRRMLAPGYYECMSSGEVRAYAPGPDGTVVPYPRTVVCGHRYQEGVGPALGQCDCGVFAVATCQQCGKPLCGNHMHKWHGRIYCRTHREELAAADAKTKAIDECTAFCKELQDYGQRVSDPLLRKAVVKASFSAVNSHGRPVGVVAEGGIDAHGWDRILRDVRDYAEVRTMLSAALSALGFGPEPSPGSWILDRVIDDDEYAALVRLAFERARPGEVKSLPMRKHLALFGKRDLPAGSIRAILLSPGSYQPPSGDFQVGSGTPASWLLESGYVWASGGSLSRDFAWTGKWYPGDAVRASKADEGTLLLIVGIPYVNGNAEAWRRSRSPSST
jgi:hypothetical protein